MPAGQRAVIEFATCFANFGAFGGTDPTLSITTTVGSDAADHFLPLVPLGSDLRRFGAAQQMTIYADPGTTVTVTFTATNTAFGGALNVSVSGYLEDGPA